MTSIRERLRRLEPPTDGLVVVKHLPGETHAEALARAQERYGARARLTLPPPGKDFAEHVDDFV